MKAVFFIVALSGLFLGQVSLPSDPVPPLPPMQGQDLLPETGPGAPLAGQDPPRTPTRPAPPPLKLEPGVGAVAPVTPRNPQPMMLVAPPEGPRPAQAPQAAAKPPAFKLVETTPATESIAPRPAPLPGVTVEPLPPGSVASPCLLLLRTGPPAVKAGQAFAYEIIVRNAGSVAAKLARLEEDLPPGSRFISAQPSPMVQGDRLTWNLENLAPGAEQRIRVEVEANGDGPWAAQACLTVSVTNVLRTQVTGAPAKLLEINGPGSAPVGHTLTFPIKITNTTSAPLTDLMLRVHLSPGLQHLQGEAIEGPLGTLAPGQAKTVSLDLASTQTGNLGIQAILISGKKALAEVPATVLVTEQPILILRQTTARTLGVGTEEMFKLEVVNRSPAELRDVVLNDVLPPGLRYGGGDPPAAFDPATNTLRWSLGNLQAGQSRQLLFRATMTTADACTNRISARTADGQEAQLHTILRIQANGGAPR